MRRLLLGSIAVVAVIAVLIVGAVALIPWAAPRLIQGQLRGLGLDESEVGRVEVGTSRAEVRDLRFAPGQTAGRLSVRWDLGDLIRGQLASLVVEDLRLEVRVGADGTIELPGIALPDSEGDGGLAPPLAAERIELRDAVLVIATPLGTIEAAGAATARMEARGPVAFGAEIDRVGGTLAGAAIDARFEVAGMVDPFAADLWPTLDAAGTGTVEMTGLEVPGLGRGRASGPLTLEAIGGSFTLATSGAELVLDALDRPELLAAIGARLPVRVTLGEADAPALATVDLAGPVLAGRIDLGLEATAGGPGARLQLGATVQEVEGTADLAVRDLVLELEASGLVAGPTIRRARLALEGGGTIREATLRGRLALEGDGGIAGATARRLDIDLPLALELGPDALVLAVPDAGSLRVEDAVLPAPGVRGGARLALLPGRWLRLERATLGWELDLPARIERLDVAAAGSAVEVARGEVRLGLEGEGTAAGAGRLVIDQLALALPAQEIALAGVSLGVPFSASGPVIDGPIPFEVRALQSRADPPVFAEVALAGEITPRPDRVRFSGRATALGGEVSLEVEGRHRLDQGRGRALLDLAPVRFAPGGLQPQDLAPAARGVVEEVAGEIGLAGALLWDDAGLRSDLEVLIRDLGLVAGPVRLGAVNGVVALDDVLPLSTPPRQELAVGLLDVGLAFTGGRTRFELLPGGPLDVRALSFAWAGGEIIARPFTVGSADGVISTTLEARGLDLDAIFDQVKLPGLAGEGTIDGVLPLRVEGGQASIDGGELRARRNGWLRYRPESTPEAFAAGGESMSLLLQALENFRYDQLRITLDGRTDRDMDIGLHLKGANPDLYDGHPVEFNLNLEGELANILEQGLRSYTLPDRVRERIEQYRNR